MARVFAQEALKKCTEQGITSIYEMIVLAAHRGKRLRSIPKDQKVLPAEEYEMRGTSHAVTALREIESGNLDLYSVKDDYLKFNSSISEKIDTIQEN